MNALRGYDDKVAEAMADPVRDGKFAIEDAKKEVASFTSNIATLVAGTKELEGKRDNQQKIVAKFERIATQAGTANDADGVREALTYKQKATDQITAFNAEIKANKALEAQLRAQLNDMQDRIENATNNEVRLTAQIQSSNLRSQVAQSAAGNGSGKGLSALDDLEQAANKAKAKAEAWEDLASTTPANKSEELEKKYSGASTVSDNDVQKYMKKPSEKVAA